MKIQEVDVQSLPLNSLPNHINLHFDIRMKSSGIYGEAREQIDADSPVNNTCISSTNRESLNEFPCSSSSESIHTNTQSQSIDKVGTIFLFCFDVFILH